MPNMINFGGPGQAGGGGMDGGMGGIIGQIMQLLQQLMGGKGGQGDQGGDGCPLHRDHNRDRNDHHPRGDTYNVYIESPSSN